MGGFYGTVRFMRCVWGVGSTVVNCLPYVNDRTVCIFNRQVKRVTVISHMSNAASVSFAKDIQWVNSHGRHRRDWGYILATTGTGGYMRIHVVLPATALVMFDT
jgi:hypothetical protein